MPITTKKIAIIGGGPGGLTSIKACKEEGLEPICFERTDNFGGLWRYRDKDINGTASVMKSTIINTSKELGAFSDFPPPREFPNYMHNSMMLKYFEMYAEKFDLLQHVKLNTEVVKVVQAEDYKTTGRWVVTTRNVIDDTTEEDVFDGVMICTGHHVFPNIPTFPGLDQFKGNVIHTHSLKNSAGYEDKNVMVVGIGNSSVDAVVEVSNVAKKVYLSTRRGSWILYRVGPKGIPFDISFTRRHIVSIRSLMTFNSACSYLEKKVNKIFDHALYGLKPRHRILSQHPTVNDYLPNKILSGVVSVKGDVKKFTENGVLFEGDYDVTKIDDVIFATGYRISFPFLSEDILPHRDNRVFLYKYCFPPDLQHPTLAVMGLIQPLGAIFPISEIQARWFALLMNKKLRLPRREDMWEDIRTKQGENACRYVESPRHTIQVDWIPFMDELGGLIGAKPDFLKLALTDPKLFWACFTGPCLPYQFRLQGPHTWSGARDALLQWEDRVKAPLRTRTVTKVVRPFKLSDYSGIISLMILLALFFKLLCF